MPIAIRIDQPTSDRSARADMYGGTINVTTPSTASTALVEFARELIGEAFGRRDPELAQFDLPVDGYGEIVARLETGFLGHDEPRRLVQRLLVDRGCDPASTYFDVPRLRVSTSDDYLGTGIAYAWHPYRDTWRAAPLAQLDHWMPVYGITEDDAKAFHPEYFDRAVGNDSAEYDHDHRDATHPLPRLSETVDLLSSTTFVPPVGAILQFSGQHLHSDVPNTSGRTRFSIDFGTVDAGDLRVGLSARDVDSRCAGSTICDFMSAADLSPLPGDVVAPFRSGRNASARLRRRTTRAQASN